MLHVHALAEVCLSLSLPASGSCFQRNFWAKEQIFPLVVGRDQNESLKRVNIVIKLINTVVQSSYCNIAFEYDWIKFNLSPLCPSQFSGLYLVSLVVILIGFITFNVVPTPAVHTDPVSSSSSSICEESYDIPVPTQNDSTKQEVTVRITTEDEEDGEERQQGGGEKEEGWGEEERRAPGPSQSLGRGYSDGDVVAVGRSTKMWTTARKPAIS